MTWLHCPIPDFDGPGAAFERAWADGAGERARAILRRGGTVVSHCRGGIAARSITSSLSESSFHFSSLPPRHLRLMYFCNGAQSNTEV